MDEAARSWDRRDMNSEPTPGANGNTPGPRISDSAGLRSFAVDECWLYSSPPLVPPLKYHETDEDAARATAEASRDSCGN
jgi:hypothetical protein